MCLKAAVARLELSSVQLMSLISAQGWKVPMYLLDTQYWYTTPENWATVLNSVLLSDVYQAELYDCEDYALEAMVMVSKKHGLNTIGMVIGNTPQGRHGFNVFYDGTWWVYEPQPDYGLGYFPLGENGYVPELILI